MVKRLAEMAALLVRIAKVKIHNKMRGILCKMAKR